MECKARVRGKPCDYEPLRRVCRFCGGSAAKAALAEGKSFLDYIKDVPIYEKADPPPRPMRRLSPEELERLYKMVRCITFPFKTIVPLVVEQSGQFFILEQEVFEAPELKPTDPQDKRLWRYWCGITKTWREYEPVG